MGLYECTTRGQRPSGDKYHLDVVGKKESSFEHFHTKKLLKITHTMRPVLPISTIIAQLQAKKETHSQLPLAIPLTWDESMTSIV